MSSQLAFQTAHNHYQPTSPSYLDSYHHTDASASLNYRSHPNKRVRIDQDCVDPTSVNRSSQRRYSAIENSQPSLSTSTSDPILPTTGPERVSQGRSASVPRLQPQTKSKRNAKQPTQNGSPFIIEAVSFPDQQPWLKVKPRRRKAAVDAAKDIALPVTNPPEEGEVLSLDRDADRIAVLIAQKRKENEHSQFRHRMATQQRVHRGESDNGEKLIAASNNELKRKMELCAKGIFEDKAPSGKESAVNSDLKHATKLEPDASSSASIPSHLVIDRTDFEDSEQYHNGAGHEQRSMFNTSDVNDAMNGMHGNAVESSDDEEDDGQIHSDTEPTLNASNDEDPSVSPQSYLQYQQNAYYQSMVSTQMNVGTRQAQVSHLPQPMPANMVYQQQPVLLDHQQQHYVPNWYEEQPQLQDTSWTQQIFHSLPSTQTPVMHTSNLPQQSNNNNPSSSSSSSTINNTQGDPAMQQQRQRNGVRLFGINTSRGNSASPEATATVTIDNNSPEETNKQTSSSTNMFNSITSNLHPARFEVQPPVLRSNMNMFTRSARENGVIGGNNNIGTTPVPRRNMFGGSR